MDLSLQASSVLPELESNSTSLVQRLDILLALSLLALNVLFQPKAALSRLLKIDLATYRLLRILPIFAFLDATVCLVMIGLFWQRPEQCLTGNFLPAAIVTYDATDKRLPEKNVSKVEVTVAWSKSLVRPSGKNRVRSVLSLAAGIQLLRLTTFDGIHFSVFCAWALYASYMLNELLYKFMPDGLAGGDESLLQNDVTKILATLKEWTELLAVLAILVEFVHIAWLSRIFVPRTLWMDWGPPQMVDNGTFVYFDVPPGTPRPATLLGMENQNDFFGFWPSHTFTGVCFMFLNWMIPFHIVIMAYCMLLCSLWVILVYCITFVFCLLWGSLAFCICILWERAERGIIVPLVGTELTSSPLKSCVKGLLMVMHALGILLLITASLWLILISWYWDNVILWRVTSFEEFYFIMFDTPDGCYACLAGTSIGGLTLIFRRWVVPMLMQKPYDCVPKETMWYWDAIWGITILCMTSVMYYVFYFDVRGAYKLPGTHSATQLYADSLV